MDKDLQGKTALVTGATSGIGRAVALRCGQHGASVMVSDIDEAQGRQVVAELTAAWTNAPFYEADVGDAAQCRQLEQETVTAFGRPEVAELVIWLSSEKASFVTGAYYPVDGGYLTR